MANYTLELQEMKNKYGIEIFDFNYPFYTEDKQIKQQFEDLFFQHYYFYEIGAETPERWKQMLKGRLKTIMPYYEQLYQTEWFIVKKDMMVSKDLVETTIHTLKGTSQEQQHQQSEAEDTQNQQSKTNGTSHNNSQQSSTSDSTGTSTGEGTSSNHQTDKESALENGVPQVSLSGDLTRIADSTNESTTSSNSSSTASSEETSVLEYQQTDSQAGEQSTSSHSQTKGQQSNQQQNELEEKTEFHSKGDVGIQTPAYAITEWRKVIININQMILDDLRDLFILIY